MTINKDSRFAAIYAEIEKLPDVSEATPEEIQEYDEIRTLGDIARQIQEPDMLYWSST